MTNNKLGKLATKKAAEVCQNFCLGETAKKLLTPELTAEAYLQLLMQQQQYLDAVRVLAYGLPATDAIRWACSCARQHAGANPPEKISTALQAVEKWLAEPTDESRRSAMKAANEAEFSTPAGSAALAVFFSGGSIAPPDMTAVPPEPSITPNSVAGSVMLAAVLKEPEKAQEKYQLFLAEGLKIASIQ
jgi:hypothetical protein